MSLPSNLTEPEGHREKSGTSYPPDLADAVVKGWSPFFDHIETKFRPSAPVRAELLTLMETAFHASMMAEEGRRIRFRIGLLPEDRLPKDRSSSHPHIVGFRADSFACFANPWEFTADHIRKLALAAKPERSIIIVGPSTKMVDGWKIWGIYHTGDDWHLLGQGQAHSAGCPPEIWMIASYKAGHLQISHGSTKLYTLEQGRISPPSPQPPLKRGVLADKLRPVFARMGRDAIRLNFDINNVNAETGAVKIHNAYRRCLHSLLAKAADLGSGGTIVILLGKDTDTAISLPSSITSEMVLKSIATAFSPPGKFYAPEHWSPGPEGRVWLDDENAAVKENDISRFTSLMADLSSIDGALILGASLRLQAFGAKLNAASTLDSVFIASNADATQGKLRELSGGTRHRSAVRFCDEVENSVVFVLSQDGGVKAITKDTENNRVVMWESIDVGSMNI